MKENEVNLETKIREALPRLRDLSKGCLLGHDGENVDIEIINTNKNAITYIDAVNIDKIMDVSFEEFSQLDMSVIGHPIKLNDVLEYWKKRSNATSATSFKNELYKIVIDWDLSSVFLADQSEELKEFLNDL